MRGLIIFVFLSLAVAQVLGDEKEDAIKSIEKAFSDVKDVSKKILSEIEGEKSKQDPDAESDAKDEGNKKTTKIKEEFSEQIIESIKTAIIKGKPLDSIDCIKKTELEGKNVIASTAQAYTKAVENVWPNKLYILEQYESEVKLIIQATEGLKNTYVEKIVKAVTGVQSIKQEALAKIETANKRLKDAQNRLVKPVLKEVYNALKNGIEKKYNDIKKDLFKKLQKCVS